MLDFESLFHDDDPPTCPIPPELHSLEAGGPFQRCLQCGCHLLETNLYMIERVFRGTEPIIEYAMCFNCAQGSSKEISQASREHITRYFRENMDFSGRAELARECFETGSVEQLLNHCVVTGANSSDCRERQICAWCDGDKVRLDLPPIMISGAAVEALSEQLSEQTKGWMNDFVGDNFGMPSEFIDSPDMAPILF